MSRIAAFLITMGLTLGAACQEPPVLNHRLAAGQTMAWVARSYGVSLAEVVAANADLDPLHLMVGTAIKVPPPVSGWPQHRVLAGQSASQIAQQGGFSLELLANLNPGLDLERIHPEQMLNLPVVGASTAGGATASLAVASPAPASEVVVEAKPSSGLWEPIVLADGRRGWAPRQSLMIPPSIPLTPLQVVDLASRFVGAPYVWGGMTPNGVDCSGYVQEVYRLAGHSLPRLADDQFYHTKPVEQAQPGDLVFFTTYLPGPSHVGISLGGQEFIHASSSRGVVRSSLEESYYKARFLGARRLPKW